MNNLTLVCDMNYVLMSRYSVAGGFEEGSSVEVLTAAKENLTNMIARSINIMLNRFPVIDNIVLVGDGGSWRKQLPIPSQLKEVKYKGNRESKDSTNWHYVFESLRDLMKNAEDVGVTVSQTTSAEGDDWIWYWSRRLNAEGTNVLIWSIDRDLQQLVQKTQDGVFTAWYSDRGGLCLPEECSVEENNDPMDFFMSPPSIDDEIIDALKTCAGGKIIYVNPADIVIEKVLCGDAGDNIKSVVRFEKNNKTYRFSEGDLKKYQEHDLPMTTVSDLKESLEDIADWIIHSKKFSPYHFKKDDIIEMLKYNIKLVWLNEETIPWTVIQSMNNVEYKMSDTQSLRFNYKLLAKTQEDTNIEDIFEEITK